MAEKDSASNKAAAALVASTTSDKVAANNGCQTTTANGGGGDNDIIADALRLGALVPTTTTTTTAQEVQQQQPKDNPPPFQVGSIAAAAVEDDSTTSCNKTASATRPQISEESSAVIMENDKKKKERHDDSYSLVRQQEERCEPDSLETQEDAVNGDKSSDASSPVVVVPGESTSSLEKINNGGDIATAAANQNASNKNVMRNENYNGSDDDFSAVQEQNGRRIQKQQPPSNNYSSGAGATGAAQTIRMPGAGGGAKLLSSASPKKEESTAAAATLAEQEHTAPPPPLQEAPDDEERISNSTTTRSSSVSHGDPTTTAAALGATKQSSSSLELPPKRPKRNRTKSPALANGVPASAASVPTTCPPEQEDFRLVLEDDQELIAPGLYSLMQHMIPKTRVVGLKQKAEMGFGCQYCSTRWFPAKPESMRGSIFWKHMQACEHFPVAIRTALEEQGLDRSPQIAKFAARLWKRLKAHHGQQQQQGSNSTSTTAVQEPPRKKRKVVVAPPQHGSRTRGRQAKRESNTNDLPNEATTTHKNTATQSRQTKKAPAKASKAATRDVETTADGNALSSRKKRRGAADATDGSAPPKQHGRKRPHKEIMAASGNGPDPRLVEFLTTFLKDGGDGNVLAMSQLYREWTRRFTVWPSGCGLVESSVRSRLRMVSAVVRCVDRLVGAGCNLEEVLQTFDQLQKEMFSGKNQTWGLPSFAKHIKTVEAKAASLLGAPTTARNETEASESDAIDRSERRQRQAKASTRPRKPAALNTGGERSVASAAGSRRSKEDNGGRGTESQGRGPRRDGLTVQQNDSPLLSLMDDPNSVYIEEQAFLYHDPKETAIEAPGEELCARPKALPPPSSPPTESDYPDDSKVAWSFKQDERVLFADFTAVAECEISEHDMRFFASMMERDDITVISEGLLDRPKLDDSKWNFDVLAKVVGPRMHHKFKKFELVEPGKYSETENMLEMTIGDYLAYLRRRDAALAEPQGGAVDTKMVISRQGLEDLTLDVTKDVLYMIDLDLPRILPDTTADFVANFKMKEILPGGKWCMMDALPSSARPFMGPNMYIAPGGAYTQLHQDGHGTVDSGHYCVDGFNEVVMLRRLPERHKVEACKKLPSSRDNKGNRYDAMYGLPHSQTIRPDWPTTTTIADWKEMGYCPSVFILKPGQHVHINKGRLHAFRKATRDSLPSTDCHFQLRQALISELGENALPRCVSVAWDWQFSGVDAAAINREVSALLSCALLVNKEESANCLAIPVTSLLAMGGRVVPRVNSGQSTGSMLSNIQGGSAAGSKRPNVKTNDAVARGILPTLKFVVRREIGILERAHERYSNEHVGDHPQGLGAPASNLVRVKATIDCNDNPLLSSVDADGDDYFCKICQGELPNVYYHCDGCEEHLNKDFNLCATCHAEGRFRQTVFLSTVSDRKCTVNHTGAMPNNRKGAGCPCKKGRTCVSCGLCTACSCVCHTNFTLRRRFYDKPALEEILNRVKNVAAAADNGDVSALAYATLTEPRLLVAADRGGAGLEAKRKLLEGNPGRGGAAEAAEFQPGKERPASAMASSMSTTTVNGEDTCPRTAPALTEQRFLDQKIMATLTETNNNMTVAPSPTTAEACDSNKVHSILAPAEEPEPTNINDAEDNRKMPAKEADSLAL